MTDIVCGVDVSKANLDIHILPSGFKDRFENSENGIAGLAELCRAHGVELVVMEASSQEMPLFLELSAQGIPAARVNPFRIAALGESLGIIEKTDAIDARLIARYGRLEEVAAQTPPAPKQRKLQALASRLRQVTGDLAICKQRLHSTDDAECVASLKGQIGFLDKEGRRLEGEIMSLIDDDPLWSCLDQALRPMKGVANRTIAYILAELPEIGLYSNKAVAKLTGLAPIADDSGQRRGRRAVRGGRAGIRSILFLAAGTAARYHAGFKAFEERLEARGKPRRVIRIALARKLAVILNAKARDARKALANAT